MREWQKGFATAKSSISEREDHPPLCSLKTAGDLAAKSPAATLICNPVDGWGILTYRFSMTAKRQRLDIDPSDRSVSPSCQEFTFLPTIGEDGKEEEHEDQGDTHGPSFPDPYGTKAFELTSLAFPPPEALARVQDTRSTTPRKACIPYRRLSTRSSRQRIASRLGRTTLGSYVHPPISERGQAAQSVPSQAPYGPRQVTPCPVLRLFVLTPLVRKQPQMR